MYNALLTADLLTTNRPVSDLEREQIKAVMIPIDRRLQVLQDQISRQKSELDALCREEEILRASSFAYHTALSPFRNLPDDVVREICLACVPDCDDKNDPPLISPENAPLLLTRICRGFRHIALTTPSLWNAILIDFPARPFRTAAWDSDPWLDDDYFAMRIAKLKTRNSAIKDWLNRSGILPLRISVHTTNLYEPEGDSHTIDNSVQGTEMSNELLSVLFSFINRWQDIYLGCYDVPRHLLNILQHAPMPLLRSLSISDIPDGDISRDFSLIPAIAPKLIDLDIGICYLNGNINIIRRAPFLVECSLHAEWPLGIEFPAIITPISLPCLKVLTVDEENFLSFFVAVNLEKLFLRSKSFINTSVQMNTIIAFIKCSPSISSLWLSTANYVDVMKLLPLCRNLKTLVIDIFDLMGDGPCDSFLLKLVEDDGDGILCPQLEEIVIRTSIRINDAETLRKFYELKRVDNGGLARWKRAWLDIDTEEGPKNANELVRMYCEAGGLECNA